MREKIRQEILHGKVIYCPAEAAILLAPLIGGYDAHRGLNDSRGHYGMAISHARGLGMSRFFAGNDQYSKPTYNWGMACLSIVGRNPWENNPDTTCQEMAKS